METREWLKEIRNKKLIAVEGKDDVGFFVKLLDKMKISDFFVWDIHGKDNFNIDLPLLAKIPGFDSITHFVIIRDRENDDAFESIRNILNQKMGFRNVPTENAQFTSGNPNIGIFIMPGNAIKGTMLEDLCLKTVEDHPAMKCVDKFTSCITKLEPKPQNISKAKSLAFLASQVEITNTIGLGAQKNYWNFESSALEELKQFLSNLK